MREAIGMLQVQAETQTILVLGDWTCPWICGSYLRQNSFEHWTKILRVTLRRTIVFFTLHTSLYEATPKGQLSSALTILSATYPSELKTTRIQQMLLDNKQGEAVEQVENVELSLKSYDKRDAGTGDRELVNAIWRWSQEAGGVAKSTLCS